MYTLNGTEDSHALDSGGKRARGRPKETWRRSAERELKTLGRKWGLVTKLVAVIICAIPHILWGLSK